MTITSWVSADDLENSTSDLAPSAALLASRILFSLTGRIYGGVKEVTETYLPSVTSSSDPLVTLTLAQVGIGSVHRVSPMRVGLNGYMRIPLRRRPAQSITSVTNALDGTVIDPSLYSLHGSTYLECSPMVPVLIGLKVTYTYGTSPPDDGVHAARALADELVMLFDSKQNDSLDSRLKNVTSLTRNGVSLQIEDARTILTDGRTGIPEVDLFVASVNPTRAKMRSRVLSPDGYIIR